jgi:hypothetical protein
MRDSWPRFCCPFFHELKYDQPNRDLSREKITGALSGDDGRAKAAPIGPYVLILAGAR